MSRDYQVCSRCVMDTTVPNIRFDQHGVCQFCATHDELDRIYPLDWRGEAALERLVKHIKRSGEGRDYDCICGVSGGRDSTYTLYVAVKKLGLRPLAVHFDNGWNTEIAVTNIQKTCRALDVDLETVVADWEEFSDLQRAFLRASVSDLDIPTDVAILAVLHEVAAKEGVRYILNGHSFRTEGVAPLHWTYFDGRYISAVQRQFGTRDLKDYRNFGIGELLSYTIFKGIKTVPILNYVPYNHVDAEDILKGLGWTYYGGHHHENAYTKFIQSRILPQKFGIDRRRTELSAAIRTRTTTREEALAYLAQTPYECDEELIDYALEKLGLSHEDLEQIWSRPPRSFRDFPTYYPLIRALSWPIRLATALNLLPKLLHLKFLG
jgi:N-acetyl sugar amidotransferase